MKKQKGNRKVIFNITDLFLVVADKKRCFVGLMRSDTDEAGRGFVCGKVTVQEGVMISRGKNVMKMAEQLDIVSKLKLNHGLHRIKGKSSLILGADYNHN